MPARKTAVPTYQSRVEGELASAADFLTVEMICRRTGIDREHVFVALHSAFKYRAADFIKENGHTYWFATPSTDTRTKHVAERAPEEPGSRGGGRRALTKRQREAKEANDIAAKLVRARKEPK